MTIRTDRPRNTPIETPDGDTTVIIETSCNQLFHVRETERAGLEHVWFGLPVKKQGGNYVLTAAAHRLKHPVLVRKAASRVVEA